MIDLTDLRRVRLHGGTRTHATGAPGGRVTVCGKWVHLEVCGRRWDEPRGSTAPVTCRACLRGEGADR